MWMIVAVILIVLGLVNIDSIKNFAMGESHREICRRQVDVSAISTSFQATANCPILNVTIKGDPNSMASKELLANTMRDARYVYDAAWQGNDLFGAESGTFCAVYAIVNFAQKDKSMFDFNKYLTKPYSFTSEKSYADYFSTGNTGLSSNLLPSMETSELPSKDKYAVIFWYVKDHNLIDSAVNNIGCAVAGSCSAGGARTFGKIAAIGAGSVLGIGGGILMVTGVGAPGGLLLWSAAGAVVGGGTTVATLTYNGIYKENPVKAVQIIVATYNSTDDLEALGCKIFPVSLGTRPQ